MASGHDIAMALRTAYWAMHRSTEASFARRAATADQFVLLHLLAEQDGITQQELVRRASSDANTIRAMLVLLEKRGLVTRERHPTDGRARSVTLTPKGRQTHEKLWAQSEPLRERLLAAVGVREAEALARSLDNIVRMCEAASESKCKGQDAGLRMASR